MELDRTCACALLSVPVPRDDAGRVRGGDARPLPWTRQAPCRWAGGRLALGALLVAASVVAAAENGGRRGKGRSRAQETRQGDANVIPRTMVIAGTQGGGSGFLIRLFDRTWVASNAHVLAGIGKLKIVTNDGSVLPWRQVLIGRREDVALFEVDTDLEPLQLVASVEQSVRIGAQVIAYGNSGAKGAITESPGEVLGIGPAEIEVSAPIVPGNSGGPIVLRGTDRVIGIAARGAKDDTTVWNQGTRFDKVRRFAVRLDSLGRDDFQEVDPEAFSDELRQVQSAEKRNALGTELVRALKDGVAAGAQRRLGDEAGKGLKALVLNLSGTPDRGVRTLVEQWNRTVESNPAKAGKERLRDDLRYRLRKFRAYLAEPFPENAGEDFRHLYLRGRMRAERAYSQALLQELDNTTKEVVALLDQPEPQTWPPEPPRLPYR